MKENKEITSNISFYVAESMEIPSMGETFRSISTIEEAIKIYDNIPENKRNMGNGIGINIDGVDYSLYENGDVDTLEFYESDIKDNESVQQAIITLHNYIADKYIEKYENKGFEFPNKENFYDKYKKNLYHNIQKYEDLGYKDKSIVFLAKASSRYIDIDKTNIHPDMTYDEIENIVNTHAGIIKFSELEKLDFVILDSETTGFKKDDEIVELGIIDKKGNILYEEMFYPQKEISEEASKVTGITMNDLAVKPSFGQEVERIINIIGDKPIVIFNKDFDTRLFMQSIEAHKDDILNYENVKSYLQEHFNTSTYCAMQSYTEFKNDYKATKLIKALAEQGIEKEQNHRAVSDCIDTLNLIQACAEKEQFKEEGYKDMTVEEIENIENLKVKGENEAETLEIIIDNTACIKVDEWTSKEGNKFVIGSLVEDKDFFLATVNGENVSGMEYDYKPSREEVEEDYLNYEAIQDIDEHEYEYGADGNRVFPNLNAEKITLHIEYQNPININGFIVKNDTIVFDSQIELNNYINGEAAYDAMDNAVTKKDNEILLHAEDEHGNIIWKAKEEQKNIGITLYEEITVEQMNKYGYTWDGMVPLTQEQAVELFDRGLELYKIYEDGSEAIIDDIDEITEHADNAGMFGISKQDADYHIYFEKKPELEEIKEFKVLQELNYSKDTDNGIETREFECEINGKPEKVTYTKEEIIFPFHEQIKESIKIGERDFLKEYENDQISIGFVMGSIKNSIEFNEWKKNIENAKDLDAVQEITEEIASSLYQDEDGKEYAILNSTIIDSNQIAQLSEFLKEKRVSLAAELEKNENENSNEVNLGDDNAKKNDIMSEGKTIEGDNNVNLSDKERKRLEAEQKREEALNELTKQLEDGVKKTLDSEEFANWCKKQGRLFHNGYSFKNAMLTYLQKEDATYVCGYEKWKDYGRQVKAGAKGIKIFTPLYAKNYYGEGSFFNSIKKSLQEQLNKESSLEYATYHLGKSKLSFTMYRNGLFDVNSDKKTVIPHMTPDAMRKFLEQNVIGKVPIGYNVGYVYDISDTIEPDTLFVSKNKCRNDELVLDGRGNPITDKTGKYKIRNTDERKAVFRTDIDMTIKPMETDKMQILYESLQSISEANGIPMSEASPLKDSTLQSGALGYFRHPSEQFPKGNIVISSDLSVTDKVAVAFHEIAHSELHVDLDNLKEEMDLDAGEVITQQMKEMQAEAVAYMAASAFGIETSHKSFSYIANWSDGRTLESFEKSINVIYDESKSLLKKIESDLFDKGFDMALQTRDKTPFTQEYMQSVTNDYMQFTLNTMRSNETLQKAAFDALQTTDNPLQQTILKEQIAIAQKIDEKLMAVNSMVNQLEKTENKDEQISLKYKIEAAKDCIAGMQEKIDTLSQERLDTIREDNKDDIKQTFIASPAKGFAMLKKEFPDLKDLPKNDVKFITSSQFILSNYSDFLGKDNAKFVQKALEHLDNFHTVLSKNKTAVEINKCEQWGEKPIFENGTLLHPKEANRVIAAAEKETRILKKHADKNGEYYPYSKCSMNIYSLDEKDNLAVAATRVDIGDGYQKDLNDFLTKALSHSKKTNSTLILENFQKSIRERNTADKIIVPSKEVEMEHTELQNDIKLSREEWQNRMDNNTREPSSDKDKEIDHANTHVNEAAMERE